MVSKACVKLLCATLVVCLIISNVSCQTTEAATTHRMNPTAEPHTTGPTDKPGTTTKKSGAGQLAICLPLVLVSGLLAIKNHL